MSSAQSDTEYVPEYGPKGRWHQLRAERDRYREALELISSRYEWDASMCPRIARKALDGAALDQKERQ